MNVLSHALSMKLIMLLDVKTCLIVGVLMFMSRIND